jgi:hypothetical protein
MIFKDAQSRQGCAAVFIVSVIDYIISPRHNTMNRMSLLILLSAFTLVFPGPRTMVTLIHATGDGYITSRTTVSTIKEVWVQGSGEVITWISFNLKGYRFAQTRTCMLALHITAVKRSGICDFHPITSPVITSESKVTRRSVKYDDLPLVTVPLDSSYSGQMLFMNITDLAKSGAFYGIVIRSRGNLDASFSAREGIVAPAILCTHDVGDSNAVSWFSNADAPDRHTGKKGDFLVRTSNGALYYKSPAGWDSVAIIKAAQKKTVHNTTSRRAKKIVQSPPRR